MGAVVRGVGNVDVLADVDVLAVSGVVVVVMVALVVGDVVDTGGVVVTLRVDVPPTRRRTSLVVVGDAPAAGGGGHGEAAGEARAEGGVQKCLACVQKGFKYCFEDKAGDASADGLCFGPESEALVDPFCLRFASDGRCGDTFPQGHRATDSSSRRTLARSLVSEP